MSDAMKYDAGSNVEILEALEKHPSLYNQETFEYPRRNVSEKAYFSAVKRSKYFIML
jgi:hypothetical protein